MDLSGNEITSLPGRVFMDFTSLSLIVLSHNKIATIGPRAFGNRKSFWILYLDNNQLTEISEEIFAEGNIQIQSIHIEYNRLTFLSQSFVDKTNTSQARIAGNPWQCACYDMVQKWNTWEVYEPEKASNGAPRCIEGPAPSMPPICTPVVDFEFIENYEKKYPRKENKEDFCKTYLQ